MPKISVIMPLYNSAEYLKQAIESILSQTFTDWEFIIVNEYGSDDGSREIVEKYAIADRRFILIQNTTKLGISASINRGLEISSGKYIARMDADDISLPERFEKQAHYLDSHPSIAACGVKVEIFGANPFEWTLETSSDQIATNILFYSPCVHPTVMMRRDFLEKYRIQYNHEYKASEDYDLFSRICNYGVIANIDEVLFRYRIMSTNATFKNNDIGMVLYCEVMERQFKQLDLNFTEDEIRLLSPHFSVKYLSGAAVLKALEQLSLLLQKIFVANEKKGKYNQLFLWRTLHRRFKETYESTEWFCKNFDSYKLKELYTHSIFAKEDFYQSIGSPVCVSAPEITVLIPTYNSEGYLMGAIWSVLEQSYQDFEILIINEYGSDDDTVFISKIFHDNRIRLIQNSEKLGLANSLNLGIKESRGRYVARLDADDLCSRERLKMQIEFLESNQDYGICGSWQHHFGIRAEWVHKCSINHEDIQAELIFNCDLCHSTLMLRKEYFIQNDLFYDSSYAAEDYELWTRAVKKFKIANLPVVLGEYRVGESNITAIKMEQLSLESGQLAARNIEYYFGIHMDDKMIPLQSGWRNEFDKLNARERAHALEQEKNLLRKMWTCNQKKKLLNADSLLKTINKRWRFVTNTWQEDGEIYNIDDLFHRYEYNNTKVLKLKSRVHGLSLKRLIKGILRRPYYAVKSRTVDVIVKALWDADGHTYDYYSRLMQACYDMDGHLYDYFTKLSNEYQSIGVQVNEMGKNVTALNERAGEIEQIITNSDLNLLYAKLRQDVFEEIKQSHAVLEKTLTSIHQEMIQSLLERENTNLQDTGKYIAELVESRLQKSENYIREKTDSRIENAEQKLCGLFKTQLLSTEQSLLESVDARVEKAERTINETTDGRIWKAELGINEKTDARIWKAEQNTIENQEVLANLLMQFQVSCKKAILLNTPQHDNLGDHAIAFAEQCWLKDHTDYHVIDITGEMFRRYHKILIRFISDSDILLLSGGGYLGTLWPYEEELVEQVVSEYPLNKICIFPQSVFFSDDEDGRIALEQARRVFEGHKQLYIFLREDISYLYMKEYFPKCNLFLSVDMAMYLKRQVMDMITITQDREGILLCLKKDKESCLNDESREIVIQAAQELGSPLLFLDTVTGYSIDETQRYSEIRDKLNEFAKSRFVITDRLHGIIFSALTRTPCIALKGVSHKNKGICDALGKFGAVFYFETPEALSAGLEGALKQAEHADYEGLFRWASEELENLENFF